MEQAKLSDVKDGLSRYVEKVRKGARVRILVRGVAVADLVPIDTKADLGEVEPELLKPGQQAKGRALSDMIVDERHRR